VNYIHALQNRVADLERAAAVRQANIQGWLHDFRAHLISAKFQGQDPDGSRRDWIATADVNRWLDTLREHLVD
jgi:acid stress-induced BolA-like protein IbaG/YrbA